MVHRRRRGTAIVENSKGILVTSGRHKVFLLPGGNAKKGESRRRAAIRELKEETDLDAYHWEYLFEYDEPEWARYSASHKVFLIKAKGYPKPSHHDVKYIDYWTPNSQVNISKTTKKIIDRYLEMKNKSNEERII